MLVRLESAPAARHAYSRPALRARRYLLGLGLLIVALPSAALNGLIAFRLGALFGPTAGRIVVGLWLLSAVPLLWSLRSRTVQRDSGIRQPDLVEAPRLAAAWHGVAGAAGIRESAYSVRVQESNDASGSALPGRVVAVTSTALRVASTRQVGAVLAHELGHQVAAGVWRWPVVLDWYALFVERLWLVKPLPVVYRWSDRETERAPDSLRPLVILVLGMVGVLGGGIAVSVLLIGPIGAILMVTLAFVRPLARAALDRYGEYLADRLAVDLGYGIELRSYLRVWGTERSEKNIEVTMVATHPTRDRRIRAINTRLRHHGQTTTG